MCNWNNIIYCYCDTCCIKKSVIYYWRLSASNSKKCIELKIIPERKTRLTKKEIMKKIIVCILFVLLFAFIVYKFNGANTFIKGFMNSYIIWLVIAWYDALIIDCIFFCHSKKVRVPGTENMKEYEDYWFHIKGSIRGSIIGIPACALVGLLVIIL